MDTLRLNIPNVDWARDARVDGQEIDAGNWGPYQENLWAVLRWSRLINCGGDGYTRTDWTTIPWRPSYQDWTPQHAEMMYCRMEDWSTQVCARLHVPFKRWGYENPRVPAQEVANWRAVEDWAGKIGGCCQPGEDGFPPCQLRALTVSSLARATMSAGQYSYNPQPVLILIPGIDETDAPPSVPCTHINPGFGGRYWLIDLDGVYQVTMRGVWEANPDGERGLACDSYTPFDIDFNRTLIQHQTHIHASPAIDEPWTFEPMTLLAGGRVDWGFRQNSGVTLNLLGDGTINKTYATMTRVG